MHDAFPVGETHQMRNRFPNPIPPLLILLAVLGCADRTPVGPAASTPAFAKGGNGNGGGSASSGGADDAVEIASVEPDTAQQAQTLDVVIRGTGFEAGSEVDWAIDGLVVSDIRTNRVTFLSSKRLAANITVDPAAALTLYDVVVTTPPGRRGIGSELMEVKAAPHCCKLQNGEDPLAATFDDARAGVRGDAGGTYTHDLQSTANHTTVKITESGGLNLFLPDYSARALRIRVVAPGGTVLEDADRRARMTAARIRAGGSEIIAGLRGLAVGQVGDANVRFIWDEGDTTFMLRFGRECEQDIEVEGERAVVLRSGPDEWTISSRTSGRLCKRIPARGRDNGLRTVALDVDAPFSVTLQRIPVP